MTFPVVGSNIPGSYQISNSLRFNDGDTPYLTRSTGTTNKRTFTVSVWAKRSTTGARQTLWSSDNNTNDTGDGTKGGSGNYISFWNNGEFMFGGFGGSFQIRGDGLQRDIAGWYHIVAQTDTTQATTNDRGKLWINGVQQTTYTSMIGQNIDVKWATNRIGVRSDQANYSDPTFFTAYMDGYLAELHVVDGQALTASDFGEYDEDSGIWKPKQYAGTYGTDGYYLKFNNTGNMGEDSSGNDNTWTPTNLSGTTDVTTDTPTNNFATLNPLSAFENDGTTYFNGNYTMAEGNTRAVSSGNAGTWGHSFSTIGMSSGKWYWEVRTNSISNSTHVGVSQLFTSGYFQNQTTSRNINLINGSSTGGAGAGAYNLSAFSAGDILMIALDMDNGEVYFGKNGTWGGSGNPATNTNPCFTGLDTTTEYFAGFDLAYTGSFSWNYGSPDFSISSGNSDGNGYGNFEYAPPSGYLALCTQNLATALSPTIDDGSQYFNTVLYTGNASTNNITGVGFQPDWLWIKGRSSASNHRLFDSTRGNTKYLVSNNSDAEGTDTTALTSFDSDGFSLVNDGQVNGSGTTYASWNWLANGGTTSSNTDGSITSTVQANTTAGFSIITYTGTGANATVGHGLGVAPAMTIHKRRDSTSGWLVYHQGYGATKYLQLNSTDATTTASFAWNDTEPTSSVISLGYAGGNNASGGSYVAYCFAEIEGYSKFGSYEGNNSTDGTFVYTGFAPSFVMVKNIDAAYGWQILDNKRDPHNVRNQSLFANLSNAEDVTTADETDFLSNGFKNREGGNSANDNYTYIYMAFAENPFVTSGATPVTAQ